MSLGRYVARRLLLIVPTLIGIMAINFAIVQVAPGGPVEQALAELSGEASAVPAPASSGAGGETGVAITAVDSAASAGYRGSSGIDPELIRELERQFGFDRPLHERFLTMLWNYARFDFGDSFFQDASVMEIVLSKLPVSMTLGFWTLLIVYGISIPLGIAKAVRDGTRFDLWTSFAIFVGYAVPGFLFAILFIVLFAGGSFLEIFPMRGLVSEGWSSLSPFERVVDYMWHIALPVGSIVLGGFATLTMLTKNSFIEEIGKQFVLTARSKGLSERRVLYGHVFRNAMLLVIAGFPQAFIGLFFTGSLLIEVIFSLDGLGYLGFNAALNRDYPVMFGTLWVFGLLGLLMGLLGDLMYVVVDPRIDFEARRT